MKDILVFIVTVMAATFVLVTAIVHNRSIVEDVNAQVLCDCLAATPEPPTPTSGGEA